ARRIGIVATSPVGRAGFNDGILFPYELSTGGPASAPVIPEAAVASVESKKPEKRKLHAIAVLVDFSDNYRMRRPKDFEKLRFDTDNDGFVDAIFLIHAGGGAEAEPNPTKRKNMIWSHKWTLPQPFVNQGVKVFAYCTEPEDGRVGVFSHELGHLLGLPDLYDATYRSHGIGDWCLMAGGSWGGEGNRPARMSCWCLSKLGWIKPKVVTGKETLQLDTLE